MKKHVAQHCVTGFGYALLQEDADIRHANAVLHTRRRCACLHGMLLVCHQLITAVAVLLLLPLQLAHLCFKAAVLGSQLLQLTV